MEDTLGEVSTSSDYTRHARVLILVLMEDTLGDIAFLVREGLYSCLNPCSNGRYSRSQELFNIDEDVLS